MANFSIDLERFYEEMSERKEQIKGIWCLQYPIYCIHSNILDLTEEPLEKLDSGIVEFIFHKANSSPFQIAALLGTSKAIVEQRLKRLEEDHLIIKQKEDNSYQITPLGLFVFKEKTQERQHLRSYDFYLDGLTLEPLENIYYNYYTSRFISEYDSYYYTNSKGVTKIARPFAPDIVHTPPDKTDVLQKIFKIEKSDREKFAIPIGLQTINDISFTKLSLPLLVAVRSNSEKLLIKEVVDPFPVYSLTEEITYYKSLRRNVLRFENNIKDRIENLEFRISIPQRRVESSEEPRPIITTNWAEIDKYRASKNRCFNFSSEDLTKLINQAFSINHIGEESVVNSDSELEIRITRKMLIESPNRAKLVTDLIRQRDYKFGNPDNNVFILYLYFNTADEFVQNVVQFKTSLLKEGNTNVFGMGDLQKKWPDYQGKHRQLLIASGEYDLLERIDIKDFMIKA